MKRILQTICNARLSVCFLSIFILAIVTRFYLLGEIPADIHQDEAHVGYDAFSLLISGADSWGNINPVYLMGWGSGTSILYALLAKFAFFIFDVDVWALRLPQALFSVISCYVFYRLLRLFYKKPTALLGFFLITIVPWHIMTARWALDANVAPAFWLLGFYFYCKGVKRGEYLYLSALFYALCMYAYASIWFFVAVTLPMQWGYLLWLKRSKAYFYKLLYSGLVFVVLVVPLMLLILVNQGIIGEIKTAYFTVPKLLFWRGQEIGLEGWQHKIGLLSNILIKQNEGWVANMVPGYGLFYMISPLFMLLGGMVAGYQAYCDFKYKRFSFATCVLWQVATGLIYGLMIFAFSNRINFLFIPLLVLVTLGISIFFRCKPLFLLIVAGYLYWFCNFSVYYLTRFNGVLAGNYLYSFSYGIKDAIKEAEDLHLKTGAEIHVLEEPYTYAKVLFYSKVNPKSYQKSVTWYDYPNAFVQAVKFLYYHFDWVPVWNNLSSHHIYVAHKHHLPRWQGREVKSFGNYIVVAPQR